MVLHLGSSAVRTPLHVTACRVLPGAPNNTGQFRGLRLQPQKDWPRKMIRKPLLLGLFQYS